MKVFVIIVLSIWTAIALIATWSTVVDDDKHPILESLLLLASILALIFTCFLN